MFNLQDHVTARVISAIAPKVQVEEIKRAKRKPTENLTAYDYYLRGLAKARQMTVEANRNREGAARRVSMSVLQSPVAF